MSDCPFCHPDPRRLVAESPLALTLRDAFPLTPGHTLIVPRRHFANLFDATGEEIAAIWQALGRAAADLGACPALPDQVFPAADARAGAGPAGGPPAATQLAGTPGRPGSAPTGFNVGVNVGRAAGQTVMHLHVHLIPRVPGDQPDPRGGIRRIFPERADYWSIR